jgi:hypothetical protein
MSRVAPLIWIEIYDRLQAKIPIGGHIMICKQSRTDDVNGFKFEYSVSVGHTHIGAFGRLVDAKAGAWEYWSKKVMECLV